MDESEAKRRAAYGRGLYEGLRLAGINNPEVFMNEAKLQQKEEGLNGMAKKVLDVVPIQESWTKQQIVAELRRIGSNAGIDVVESCLNTLRGRGLVKESERGVFTRCAAKRPMPPGKGEVILISGTEIMRQKGWLKTEQPKEEPMQAAQIKPQAEKSNDTMTKIASIAESLRKTANELDGIALEYEERMQAIERDTDKLRQLQTLLKSLGQ